MPLLLQEYDSLNQVKEGFNPSYVSTWTPLKHRVKVKHILHLVSGIIVSPHSIFHFHIVRQLIFRPIFSGTLSYCVCAL